MTTPTYRSVEAFTGRKSPIPAILAAADEISGQAAELERLRAENERLRSYRSVPPGMVWQDYYSPDEVLKIREPLDAELERLRDDNAALLCRRDELAAEVLELRQKLAQKGIPA